MTLDKEKKEKKISEVYTKNNLEDLEILLKEYLYEYPEDPFGFLFEGLRCLSLNDLKKSKSNLLKSIRIDNNNSISHNAIALVHKRLGSYEKALDHYKISLKINPNDISTNNNLSILYREMQDFENSLRFVNKALDIDFDNIISLRNKSSILFDAKDFESAEQVVLKIYELAPEDWNNLFMAAIILMKRNEFNKALFFFEKAFAINSNDTDLLFDYSKCLTGARKYEEASEIILKALDLSPNEAKYYNHLASIHRLIYQPEKAIQFYKKAIELNNKDSIAMNNIGAAYFELGNLKDAKKYYDKVNKIGVITPEFLHNYGNYYAAIGNFSEAKKSYIKALKLDKNFYDSFKALAQNNMIDLNHDLTKEYLLEYERNDLDKIPKSTLGFAFGLLFDRAKRYKEAFSFFDEANTNYRLILDYKFDDQKNNFNSIKSSYDEAFNNKIFNKTGYETNVPIFIVGLPRSGSTLIEQVISSHSDIYGAGEIRDFSNVIRNIYKFSNDTHPFKIETLENTNFNDLGKKYIKSLKKKDKKAKFITDKTLNNFKYIGLIKAILPKAKIINIRRNKLDNCLSIFTRQFAGKHDYAYNFEEIYQYANIYEDLMNYWINKFESEIYSLSYESFVNDVRLESKKLFSYLEIPFESNIVNFTSNKRSVQTASAYQVRNPLFKSSVNRFNNYKEFINKKINFHELEE